METSSLLPGISDSDKKQHQSAEDSKKPRSIFRSTKPNTPASQPQTLNTSIKASFNESSCTGESSKHTKISSPVLHRNPSSAETGQKEIRSLGKSASFGKTAIDRNASSNTFSIMRYTRSQSHQFRKESEPSTRTNLAVKATSLPPSQSTLNPNPKKTRDETETPTKRSSIPTLQKFFTRKASSESDTAPQKPTTIKPQSTKFFSQTSEDRETPSRIEKSRTSVAKPSSESKTIDGPEVHPSRGSRVAPIYEAPNYTIAQKPSSNLYNLTDFDILQLIGKGGFAKVYQVRHKADQRIYAMKIMRKDNMKKKRQYLDEPDAKFYAAEIFMGLSFLHSQGVIYRDLKPENVLFDGHGHCKIADLGFAKKLGPSMRTSTFCGTPSYLAPEVLMRKEYTISADLWTFSILIFQLSSGCSPFQDSSQQLTFRRILTCDIRWPPNPQQYFSQTVFDLMMRLFEVDPEERLTATDIQNHPWFLAVDFEEMREQRVRPPSKVEKACYSRAITMDPNASREMKRSVGASKTAPMMEELSKADPVTRSTEAMFVNF